MKRRIFRHLQAEFQGGYSFKAGIYMRLSREKPWILSQWKCFRNASISRSATVRADAFRLSKSL